MNKSKRIGILTQPLRNNYGGLIQNYALQKVLRDLGHEPITISVSFRDRNRYYQVVRALCINIINKFILGRKVARVMPIIANGHNLYEKSKKIRNFAKLNINATETLSINSLKRKDFLDDFDAFIVGSDQVWRPKYSPSLSTYYLDFLPLGSPIKRIAYAASFGVDYWEYSKKQTEICKKLVCNFDSISVREDSGVKLCRQFLGVDASHLLDPTLLLCKNDFLNLIKGIGKQRKSRNLMVYVLDMNPLKREIINKVSNYLNLSINSVFYEKDLSPLFQKDIERSSYPAVEEWISGFNEAEFVVTDSFHGSVFSIIFNKPFISIANRGRGSSRFYSLLERLNLSERIIDEKDEVTRELLEKEVDYTLVKSIIDKLKSESIEFITDSLA
jgi:polysaccharide pyruvyl transferase WcaK-like protein